MCRILFVGVLVYIYIYIYIYIDISIRRSHEVVNLSADLDADWLENQVGDAISLFILWHSYIYIYIYIYMKVNKEKIQQYGKTK